MDSPPTTTHDTSSAGSQMADFSSLLSHLTDAASAAWPDKFAARYKKVKVLLMSWVKDDTGVEPEVRNLEAVFRGLYHYDTEYWRIPSRRSAVELSRKVADLVDGHGQEGNLLVLYYGGHSRSSEQAGGSPVWAASRSRDSPTLQSSILNSFLGEVDCDVLLLHDCSLVHETKDTFIGNGVVETLAAGGLDSTEAGNSSFTSSLVQELAHAAHTTDWLSTVELHRRLINRLQAWTPSISFTDDAYSLVQVDRRTGQPLVDRPRRRTPTHSLRSRKPKTIVLTPLPPQTQGQSEDSLVVLNPPTGKCAAIPDGPNILVTCRLRDQHVDAEKWRQWLLKAPEGAKGIQISALFPGFGTVLIVELPLAVWDLLPSSPAISFVAYTTGTNRISEFRRALLGSDPDESEDTDQDDTASDNDWAEPGKPRTGAWRKGTRPRKAQRAKEFPASSLWPKLFESNCTGVDAPENTLHCLTLAEMQGDDKTSKATRIIRAFLQDADSPSMRYISEEIQGFCAPASFEALTSGQEVAPELVAILDETLSGRLHTKMHAMRPLSHGQLYEALAARDAPQLIDTETKDDPTCPRKRLIYITNLDPASTLALASTASETQSPPLRDFVHKHLTFQSRMDVKLHGRARPSLFPPDHSLYPQPSGDRGFQLSFHLPYYAWRQNRRACVDTRLNASERPLRTTRDVGFLGASRGKNHAYIHEAQISCMVVGDSNHRWTAYGFFDTYHDGGESKHDVHSYQSTQGGAVMDPFTCGRHMADSPVLVDAREYFMRSMESCVKEVKGEWENIGLQVIKALKPFTMNDNSRRTLRVLHEAIQILEQLTQGLASTIYSWERFKEHDLAYFGLDTKPGAPQQNTVIRRIEADIRDLRLLQVSLLHQRESFKGLTARLLTLTTHHTTQTSNALLTVAVSFLPFTLTALLLHNPAHNPSSASGPTPSLQQFTPTRYILASSVVACAAAAVFLVVVNLSAARDRVDDLVGSVSVSLRGLGEKGEGYIPRLASSYGGIGKMDEEGGGVGSGWHRPGWWPESGTGGKGKGYKPLAEAEQGAEDYDGVGTGRGLPF